MKKHSESSPPHSPSLQGYLLDGRWRILPRENRITGPDLDRRIADKFMRVLVCLCARPGVVTREEIMAEVWPGTIVVDEVLTRAISELRKLFGDDPRAPQVIETIPKRGYRLLVRAIPLEDSGSRPASPRMSRLVMGLMGLGLAAAVSVGFWSLATRSGPPPAPTTRLLQLTSLPGVEEYPCLTPTADRLLYAWEGDQDTPTGVFVQSIGENQPLALTPPQGHYAYPAWSHDTRHVAYSRVAGRHTGLFQVSATGGQEQLLVAPRHGRPPLMPDYAPDGRHLAFAAPTGVHRGWRLEELDLKSGSIRVLTTPEAQGHYDRRPRYSPDGQTLAFLRWAEEGMVVGLLHRDTGTVRLLSVGERFAIDLDWTPDGQHLLITASDGIWIIDPREGQRRLISADNGVTCLAVADQRPMLAFTQARRDWGIWEIPLTGADQNPVPHPLIDSSFYDGQPALSPTGGRLAFVSRRGGQDGLWTADREGKGARILVRSPSLYPDAPSWSPDGQHLAFQMVQKGNSAIGIVPAEGGPIEILTQVNDHETRPSWSRDGQWLYFSRVEQGLSNIWKRPISGGPAVRITKEGGWKGEESDDGALILFTRDQPDTLGVWGAGVEGDRPRLLFPLESGELVSWTTGPGGVFLCTHRDSEDRNYEVWFHAFDGAPPALMAVLESRRNPDLIYDAHQHALLYTRVERLECDLVGIENY